MFKLEKLVQVRSKYKCPVITEIYVDVFVIWHTTDLSLGCLMYLNMHLHLTFFAGKLADLRCKTPLKKENMTFCMPCNFEPMKINLI